MFDLIGGLCSGWWIPILVGLIIRAVESLSAKRQPATPAPAPLTESTPGRPEAGRLDPAVWLLFLPGALGGLVNAAAVTSRADTAKDLPAFILALAIAAGLAAAAVNGAAWGALLALSIEAAWKFPGRVPSGLSRAGWSFFGGMLSGRFCMACMVGILRLFTPAV